MTKRKHIEVEPKRIIVQEDFDKLREFIFILSDEENFPDKKQREETREKAFSLMRSMDMARRRMTDLLSASIGEIDLNDDDYDMDVNNFLKEQCLEPLDDEEIEYYGLAR